MKKAKEIFDMVKKSQCETLRKPKKATRYYLKTFKKMMSGLFVFNLPAFLFGPIWMLYRKMYLFAFLYFILAVYLPIPYIALATSFGFLANHFYFHHLKETFLDGARKQGVNRWIIPVLVITIIAVTYGLTNADSFMVDPTLRAC